MLMEGREGDDVAVWRRQRILTVRHNPLHASVLPRRRPCLTRPSMRAWVTSERYHESMEDRGSYGEAKAATEKQKLEI